ncbi:citrate-binding protein-like [Eucalyptus grandis]|uniref:citrate-binding protein-like n=1 Tax=Eucalyptus grandis TaxID=71139 RepID=UPI00192E9B3F|nr:citrate-binding protein-like [Eucalyptus grandis]
MRSSYLILCLVLVHIIEIGRDYADPTNGFTVVLLTSGRYSNCTTNRWRRGYGPVPNRTSGAIIVQIHGNMGHSAHHYSDTKDMRRGWDQGIVEVHLEGTSKFAKQDHGLSNLYFKCGVNAAAPKEEKTQKYELYNMELKWKDIKIYKKCM